MRKHFAAIALLVLLLVAYLVVVGRVTRHPNEPALSNPTQQVWPQRRQSFLFELAPMPQLHQGEVSQGTAFNVDGAGLWLTARHVVSPCLAGLFRGEIDGQPITNVSADGRNDVALIRTATPGRIRAALHVTYFNPDVVQQASIVGFPASRPAEVAVERIGSGSARTAGSAEDVSVWVESGRSPPGDYPLAGMSGAPVLDRMHNAIGVLSAEVPRRGRVLVAHIGDWIAGEGRRIVPARSFGEDLPVGELVDRLTSSRAVARLRCSA